MQSLLLECAVRAALIALGTEAALQLLRVRSAGARHAAWSGVVAIMLLLPVWMAWGPRASLRVLPAAAAPVADSITLLSVPLATTPSPMPVPHQSWNWLAIVYFAGVVVFLLRLAIGTVRAHLLVRRARTRRRPADEWGLRRPDHRRLLPAGYDLSGVLARLVARATRRRADARRRTHASARPAGAVVSAVESRDLLVPSARLVAGASTLRARRRGVRRGGDPAWPRSTRLFAVPARTRPCRRRVGRARSCARHGDARQFSSHAHSKDSVERSRAAIDAGPRDLVDGDAGGVVGDGGGKRRSAAVRLPGTGPTSSTAGRSHTAARSSRGGSRRPGSSSATAGARGSGRYMAG